MGILDSVLGGGSQTSSSHLPGYIEDASKNIGYRVNQLIGMPGQQGFNQTQKNGLYGIINEAMGGNGYAPGAENFLTGLFSGNGLNAEQTGLASGLINGQYTNPAMAETQRVAMGGDVGQNPWLDAAFNRGADVMGENFQNNVLAGMDNQFAAAGRGGSKAYAQARGSAEDAYGRQLNDLANQVYGGAYQTDMARKDAALGQFANLGQQDVQNALAGAGLYQQGTQNLFGGVDAMPTVDAGRYSDYERLFQGGNTIQQQPWQSLQLGSSILGNLPYPQKTMTQSNPNQLGQAIGLGASLAGIGMRFSDARLKRDIRRLGALPSGLPVYRFRYVWSDAEHVGVMAQEAQRLFPSAVFEVDGWLAVDYGRIG